MARQGDRRRKRLAPAASIRRRRVHHAPLARFSGLARGEPVVPEDDADRLGGLGRLADQQARDGVRASRRGGLSSPPDIRSSSCRRRRDRRTTAGSQTVAGAAPRRGRPDHGALVVAQPAGRNAASVSPPRSGRGGRRSHLQLGRARSRDRREEGRPVDQPERLEKTSRTVISST